MSKNSQNILSNCFKKSAKTIKDYVPSTAKTENIREGIPIKFPETFEKNYNPSMIPNVLFPEWPSDDILNSFDFSNKGKKYSDPDSNLIIFPYSLRKETYSNMEWLRPETYIEKKKLIELIKEKFKNKNFYYIKNKIELAKNNLLNFDNDEKIEEENEKNNENDNSKTNIEENKSSEETEKEKEKEKTLFNNLDNMEINTKRRNSIDIAIAEGHNSFGKEFYTSKLTEEEKKLYIEYQNYLKEEKNIIIVKDEQGEPVIQNIETKNQKNKNEIQVIKNKLIPSNMDLSFPLCDYCRWVASQFQIIIDNKIDDNDFIRNIYPQNKNGVPQYNPSGLYWVKLYHMGKYRKIEIDDTFPVNKGTYENYFPLSEDKNEIWPLILTKAVIKLYSYKYKCDNYENEEIGDSSILYSLNKYLGVKVNNDIFFGYLKNLQKEKEENKKDLNNIILDKKNDDYNNDYDIIIGYINSRMPLKDEKKEEKKEEIILHEHKNNIMYSEKTLKIENIIQKHHPKRNSLEPIKKLTIRNKIPMEYFLKLEKFEKNTVISTKKELIGTPKYFEEHRFLTSDNIYKNFQKFLVKKSLKLHRNGLICDVGYTLLEFFQSGNFNMNRLKPIDFSDMKLDIKVKYKQMSPDEKAIYLEKIKDLKIKQKKEKVNRINKYMEEGSNLLFIKFSNGSILKNDKKAYEINTLFNIREIEAAKSCIKNNYYFPPENYFENTFIPKLTKDEETGEINFWTKNFYRRLLKNYFKEEQKLLEEKINQENEEKPETKNLYEEFEKNSLEFNKELDEKINNVRKGTWMGNDLFQNCFNNFILFKSMNKFKYNLNLDNIWYNYEKDIFEENENSKIVYLIKEEEDNIKEKNINNILEEKELYIIFEPNSEKNTKSISGELSYKINEETKLGYKFNELNFFIKLSLYEVTESKEVKKVKDLSLTNYFSIYNIDISTSKKSKYFFINMQSNICPFGFNIQFLSNYYKIENYSYAQFLIEYKNYHEKKINIIHPVLSKGDFYLIKTFKIEHKKEDEEKNNKIINFMTNFINYGDNIVKNNIDVVLINPITNKKVKIYYKKMFNIDFNISSFYRVELSVIPPYNVPEQNFEYIVLYNNPNVHIEVFENIYPFYIRQKYFPNKHNILFNELIFPSDLINTTLDISLEYRPNDNNNEENKINENNYSDEALINLKEQNFPSPIHIYFYFYSGNNLIFKKDFENKSLIRNLILEQKSMPKDNKDINALNKFILEAYSIKCVLDKDQCPKWLLNPNEYKGDVYWKISIFSTDALTFIKNTIKEDKEKEVMESWEIAEPGRKVKAEQSRKKYLVNLKNNNGEILSKEEEELINDKINKKRNEVIESNSNMLVTNIPPRINTNENRMNDINSSNSNKDMFYKKLPKIKNYRSLFMKNFFIYSNQNRVVKKNSLPKINQYCKTKEQRTEELNDIENKFNEYYTELKKENEKNESIKESYFSMIKEMNEKFLEGRIRMSTVENERTGINLKKIIQRNNSMLKKEKQISNFYENIKINEEELNDDFIFDSIKNYKLYQSEENNLKCKNILDETKKLLEEYIIKQIEKICKKDSKVKPEIIKKYKEIISEDIIKVELNDETKNIFDKL